MKTPIVSRHRKARPPRTAPPPRTSAGVLGIEAGGTRTTAYWDGPESAPPAPSGVVEFPGANLQIATDAALRRLLRTIARAFPSPQAVAIGIAGLRTTHDATRLTGLAQEVWPSAVIATSNDLETALAADAASLASAVAHPAKAGTNSTTVGAAMAIPAARVLVLSGTGSCCFGRSSQDRLARVGGWGHILGDAGSAYAIALDTLRSLVHAWDATGAWPDLGSRILSTLQLHEPNALVPWAQRASKAEIAALAPVVLEAARTNPHARRAIDQAVSALAEAAVACARKLARPSQWVRFVLAGGVLLRQPALQRAIASRLVRAWPKAVVVPLTTPGAVGAARLARAALPGGQSLTLGRLDTSHRTVTSQSEGLTPPKGIPTSTRLSPTEERNPRSTRLDRLSLPAAIHLMLSEDRRLPEALLAEKSHLARALNLIVRALKQGGRLFYVGAGTSGRLGVLDASECPPTFRTPPELVEGIIAGGREAIFRSVEGAEDDFDAGDRALQSRRVNHRDAVVGIAASGRTPFVWGALQRARNRGAATVLVCFNPHLRFTRGQKPDVVIAPRIGPELLTGSTRLKSGTATKLILNLFSTLAMVRLGKVVSNLMVDVNPANVKLRERAVRICRELTGADPATARAALEAADWVVKTAVARLGRAT